MPTKLVAVLDIEVLAGLSSLVTYRGFVEKRPGISSCGTLDWLLLLISVGSRIFSRVFAEACAALELSKSSRLHSNEADTPETL